MECFGRQVHLGAEQVTAGKEREWVADGVGKSDFVLDSIAGRDCIIPERENAFK